MERARYDPERHHRRSIRLRGYDYSRAGAYYVTICTRGREAFLGEVTDGKVRLSPLGAATESCLLDLPRRYPRVTIDSFVVMPNHVHGVIALEERPVGVGLRPAPTNTSMKVYDLPEIMRAFKSFSARRINAIRQSPGAAVWQRNYYERIVRSDEELDRIRGYIEANPQNWPADREHPEHTATVGMGKRRPAADDIETILLLDGRAGSTTP